MQPQNVKSYLPGSKLHKDETHMTQPALLIWLAKLLLHVLPATLYYA